MKKSDRFALTVAVLSASLLSGFTLAIVIAKLPPDLPAGAPHSMPPAEPSPVQEAASARASAHSEVPAPVPQQLENNDGLAKETSTAAPGDRDAPPVHLGSVTTEKGGYHSFITPTERIVRTLSIGGTAFGWHLYAVGAKSFLFEKGSHHYVVERR
jgi:hypothetical protein